MVTPPAIHSFQEKVLGWYETHKRNLPRRDTDDPYKVLVSEVMLQQTQVDRVIPKFLQFIELIPTLESLANVEKSILLTVWSGLGFNSRALRLKHCAQEIVNRFDGGIPRSREELRSLPGIGVYTSASILAFAYNLPAPVIDTNIRRVLIHELGLSEDIPLSSLEEIAVACIPEGRSNDWHNALMDYGSTIATAKKTGIKPLSKQSRFEGSPRQVRGNVIKRLVKYGPTSKGYLAQRFHHEQFDEILGQLHEEGLVRFQNGKVSL